MTGEEIRAARKELELTQVELGEHLDVSGNTIARWERGEVSFEHPAMLRLALTALRKQMRSGAAVHRRNTQLQLETMENLQKAGEIIDRIKQR